jgi:hypothetical protein
MKDIGEKKFVVILFFGVINFTKLSYFIFEKFGPIFTELYNFLPQKLSLSSQKYGFEIRDPEKTIPDPGVKKAPDPDPQHCLHST